MMRALWRAPRSVGLAEMRAAALYEVNRFEGSQAALVAAGFRPAPDAAGRARQAAFEGIVRLIDHVLADGEIRRRLAAPIDGGR